MNGEEESMKSHGGERERGGGGEGRKVCDERRREGGAYAEGNIKTRFMGQNDDGSHS